MNRARIHAGLRHAQRPLRWLLGAAAVVTAAVMIFLGPATFAPAVALAAIYVVVLAVDLLEWRLRPHRGAPPPDPGAPSRGEAGTPPDETGRSEPREGDGAATAGERRAAWKAGLGIGAGLLCVAVVLAAVLFDRQLVGLGALFLFAWLVFSGGAFWLAAVTGEKEEAHEALTGEKRSIE